MELWRISNYADLSGGGGLRAGGRWHSLGRKIVYLADHPSSALLEMLVHMDRDLIPATYQLLRVVVLAAIAIETRTQNCHQIGARRCWQAGKLEIDGLIVHRALYFRCRRQSAQTEIITF